MDATVPCVIPAAGLSSRMGDWKPFLPWKGGLVIDAVVGSVLEAGCLPVIVSGYGSERLEERFGPRADLVLVRNADWERGMLGSIRAGADALGGGGPGGFLVLPADMPLVDPADIRAVVAQAGRESGAHARALFASRGDRLGHPAYIPWAFLDEIRKLDPGMRLRQWLLSGPWGMVPAGSDGIFLDLDTREDYEAALARS